METTEQIRQQYTETHITLYGADWFKTVGKSSLCYIGLSVDEVV